MKKRKKLIYTGPDAPAYVLGIASDEKIWKVCWELNRSLNLDLSTGETPPEFDSSFVLYIDSESNPGSEYMLFEPKTAKKTPPMAKPFRYWLVLRPQEDKEPDIDNLLNSVKSIDKIIHAVDLSDEKDIKSLIP